MENKEHLVFKLWWRLRSLLPVKAGYPFVLEGAIAVAIVLVSLWVYSPLMKIRFAPYDLGKHVYGGFRVLDGFIPYAEMHTLYGPLEYYALALFFRLFGMNIATAGLELLAFVAVGMVAVYWALRGCVTRTLALLLTLIIGIVAFLLANPVFIAMFLAVGCMTRYSRRQHAGWLIGTGVFSGIAGAVRWDFGAYCLVVFIVALASLPLVRRVAAPSEQAMGTLRVRVRDFLLLLTSAVLGALPFYVPALLTDPLAIYRSIEAAFGIQDYRTLPWPELPSLLDLAYGKLGVPEYLYQASQSFPAYAFFFLAPLNAIALFISLRRRSLARPSVPLIVHTEVATLLGAFLLIYTNSRPQLGHMLPSMTFMLLSLPLMLWLGFRSLGTVPLRALIPSWGVLILACFILVPALLSGVLAMRENQGASREGLYTAPTLAGLYPKAKSPQKALARAEEYNALVDYIKENTAPDEFIFSGYVRHDKLDSMDVLIYFASERHAGSRDYQMDPGFTTRRDIQQQIISELKSNDVRLIVLADRPPPNEPNKSVESSGVTDLDDYIHANYVVREQFGEYFVLTKKEPADSPCSTVPASSEYGSVEQIEPLQGGSEVERDGQVHIQGWAATPEGSPPIDRIEVKVEGQLIRNPTIECIPREDLAERFGPEARHSGWQVTADLRDIEEISDPVDITVEAVDRDGGHHPLPTDSEAELRLAT